MKEIWQKRPNVTVTTLIVSAVKNGGGCISNKNIQIVCRQYNHN